MNLNQTLQAINSAEQVLIITHVNPDGDAVGSSLGLKLGLEALGKSVQLVCHDQIPTPFLFLPSVESFKQDFLLGDFDLVIIVDCGDIRRTGFGDRLKDFAAIKNKVINIDHHRKNDLHKIAAINFVDFSASSTSEIIFSLFKALKIKITANIATCLLTGIYSDTGGFRHSNTTPKVLRICSSLLNSGARLKKINESVAHFKSIPALRLWGVALSRMQIHSSLGLAVTVITDEDFKFCGALYEDIAGCVNLINAVEGAKAALIVYEAPDGTVRGSLRAENKKIDIAKIAEILGGGGIKKAAGFAIKGRLVLGGESWRITQEDSSPLTDLRLSNFADLNYIATSQQLKNSTK